MDSCQKFSRTIDKQKRARFACFEPNPRVVSIVEFAVLFGLGRGGPRMELLFQSQIHLESQIQDLSSLFEEEGEGEEDEKSFFRFRQ